MPKDVQDLMRAELKKAQPRRAPAPARRPKTDAPMVLEPAWVAVCFEGSGPRFLCSRQAGGWSVTPSPDRAFRFDDQAAAEVAASEYQRRHAGSTHDAGSSWCTKEMTLTATFR